MQVVESSRPIIKREAHPGKNRMSLGLFFGLVGEYLGRLYLDETGTTQYIVRYTTSANSKTDATFVSPVDGGER